MTSNKSSDMDERLKCSSFNLMGLMIGTVALINPRVNLRSPAFQNSFQNSCFFVILCGVGTDIRPNKR